MALPPASEESPESDFATCRRPHFVGIGGAGQSALARLLLARGLPVSGSDLRASAVTDALAAEGATVFIGHSPTNLGDTDFVIATDAAPPDNRELVEAERRGIPIWRRSKLLGWLMAEKRGIAVTGTHGKSSTTALLGAMAVQGGLDPTVVVGAEVATFRGNVRVGAGEWFVAEACEAYNAMLDMRPERAILTNLEADHLDHHKTLDGLVESMSLFVSSLQENGLLLYPYGDERCDGIAQQARCLTASFGIDGGDYQAAGVTYNVIGARFTIRHHGEALGECSLPLPGRFNVLNALSAIAMAHSMGCDMAVAAKALAGFRGIERRLEEVGNPAGVVLIDDYAHHPTEISASISGLRQRYAGRRLVIAFQPHLYSRTRDFLDGFAEALTACDALVLTDIYPAREQPLAGITTGRIAERIGKLKPDLPVLYVPVLGEIPERVAPLLGQGDVFVSMGAGDINEVLKPLAGLIDRRSAGAKPPVVVLSGGSSPEREVSEVSGALVAQALRDQGFQVSQQDPSAMRARLRGMFQGGTSEQPPTHVSAEVAFIALHGAAGENGSIQGLLEAAGLPYTGSGVLASALAMDKSRAKSAMALAGIPVVDGVLLTHLDWQGRTKGAPLPAVVKPNAQGSSVGLGFADTLDSLCAAVQVALHYDHEVLVEPWVRGIELSACVLGNLDVRVLPLTEIVPAKGIYDYEAKYTPCATEEIIPARIPSEAAEEVARLAALAHTTLGCTGLSRVDMMLTEDGPLVLEVNTVPGMTPTSIFPRAAATDGMSFGELCERLVELAVEWHETRYPGF